MKKTYDIEVDCPACAMKIEDAVKKTDGVTDVAVNFMTLKMYIDIKDGEDEKEILKKIKKTAKKIDRDFEITDI